MTRKSVFALTAILALGLSPATDAFARAGHGGGGHGGGGHGGFGGGHGVAHFAAPHVSTHGPGLGIAARGPRSRVVDGHHAHGFFARGHHRHFWHGRWWDYGIGPCWVWSDDYAEYVWVCD